MDHSGNSAAQARLSLRASALFAAAGAPMSALGFALSIYLPPHLSRNLGVPLAVVGGSWVLVRLLDVMVDPILGLLMDRTRTRIGRYRPWMVAGAPVLMASAYALFMAKVGISQAYLVGWLLMAYLASSILQLAHPAWGATLARSYDDRSRIFGFLSLGAVAGSVGILLLPVATSALHGSESQGIAAMGWSLIGLTPLLIGRAVWRVGEPVNPEAKPAPAPIADYLALLTKPDLVRLYLAQISLTLGPQWMTAIYLFFARDVMQFNAGQASILLLVYLLGGLAGAPLLTRLAMRIGKHRALMLATVAFSAGICTVFLPPKGVLLGSVPVMAWCGFMGVGFEMCIRAMLADVCDQVRLEQGKERLSLIFALNTLSGKLAAAFAIGLTYPLLQALGYNPVAGAVNTPEAIRVLSITFLAGPFVFVLLGGACMIGWRMTAARHGEIRAALVRRDAELADD